MTVPDRFGQVEVWAVEGLLPYAQNARTHSVEQVAELSGSIAEFGFTVPCLVDERGVLIAGHGRLLAAKRLGMTEVPVIRLAHLTEAQARAYRLADNRIALNAGWDEKLLAVELGELRALDMDLASLGFGDQELRELLAQPGDDEAAEEAPEPPAIPVSRPGDLWVCGKHRLLCGDSTDPSVVARLMEGERAALVFTSPPYGSQRDYTTGGVGDWDALIRGVFAALPVTDDAQVLVNLGLIHRENEWQPYWHGWLDWMRDQGWRRFGLYVWDQGPGLPGDWNGRLAPAFEFLFHFNRTARKPNKIVPCKWAGHIYDSHGGLRGKDGTVGEWTHAGQGVQETRIPDSVIRITRHKAGGIETEHPAVFPVKLPEFVMQAYSDEGAVVYEPFAGSGTTLIAAEKLGRVCLALEIAPAYVDVAVRRWQEFAGGVAALDGDGRTFDAIAAERVSAMALACSA